MSFYVKIPIKTNFIALLVMNVVELCQKLISFPSITPQSAGCLEYIAEILKNLGFEIFVLEFGFQDQLVKNLYARYGQNKPHLNFLGHVDVVPPGDLKHWTNPPFEGVLKENRLYGRGAVDMKGAIACFIAALNQVLSQVTGSVSLVLTADEEGLAINGTRQVVQWMKDNQQCPDFCLVGEPTNSATEKYLKIGRRGSLNIDITSHGLQGHVAYPEKALNPIHSLVSFLQELLKDPLDEGTGEFDPSGVQITTIDCGNPVTNIIPQTIRARCNIRFNPLHSAESLMKRICELAIPYNIQIDTLSSSEAFLTKPGPIHACLKNAISKFTPVLANFSTTGGTSDARFMQEICPVVEFGLTNETMHKVDEHVNIQDLDVLQNIYQEFISQFFKQGIGHHSS